MAPLVWTGGSRHTGLAALPHRNIHKERLGARLSLIMKPPNVVNFYFLSKKWSKKSIFYHYELEKGEYLVTQKLSAYAVSFPLLGRIRNFHPLATCAARRTQKTRDFKQKSLVISAIKF